MLKYIILEIFIISSVLMIFPLIYGEVWQVKIPAGASDLTVETHFLPDEITINVDDEVEWGNADAVVHTITSGTLEIGPDNLFDSGHLKPGAKFSHKFTEKDLGENPYFCTLHPWLKGIVNVTYIEEGFQVLHNVGSDVGETTFDIQYKVKRNLIDAKIETDRNTITFNFEGKIDNDLFVVKLPQEFLTNPNSVWIDQNQIFDFKIEKVNGVNELSILLYGEAQQVTIMGSEVIGDYEPKIYSLINQIFAVSDKPFYEKGDEIIISGEVINPSQISQLRLEVISPSGITLDQRQILLVGTKFFITIDSDAILIQPGKYDVKISAPDAKNLVLSFDYGIKKGEVTSPKKQMEMNISPEDVICNQGLQLMKKVSNGSAVCVTKLTGEILLNRGWAAYFL